MDFEKLAQKRRVMALDNNSGQLVPIHVRVSLGRILANKIEDITKKLKHDNETMIEDLVMAQNLIEHLGKDATKAHKIIETVIEKLIS